MSKVPPRYKVLIVDDSRAFRSILEKALNDNADIEVVGSVADGHQALEFLRRTPVDAITLDVEMPGWDGLQTLSEISVLAQKSPAGQEPGVIMVSAHTTKGADTTIKALQQGAFDFIAKPEADTLEAGIESLRRQLLVKIRCYCSQRQLRNARQGTGASSESTRSAAPSAKPARTFQGIVIGVSTGGPKALGELLPRLCEATELPILIVQHMPADFTKSLAESLGKHCPFPVQEGLDGQAVERRHVYLAPGGRHMMVRKTGSNAIVLSVNDQPPENGCRPAVDVLFRSAAVAFGGETLAVILTGMGADGTKGLAPLKRAGAYAIAQDEASCVVWGMPGSAVQQNLVDVILPLDKIADHIQSLCRR